MKSMAKIFQEYVSPAETIVISTHTYPDADGIGGQVAMCLALRTLGKKAICVNEEALQDRYRYLDPENTILSFDQYKKQMNQTSIDLFIVVDTNAPNRIGQKMQALIQKAKSILYVDHHPCPKPIAAIHCIDTTKAATGQLVGEIIDELKIPFTQSMALALYTAIVIDTSSFRYPTVNSATHSLVSKLLKTGISPAVAYNGIYGTKKITHMHLLGQILSKARVNSTHEIAWICLPEKIIGKYHADIEDTHAFINHLLVLDDVKIAVMFREMGKKTKMGLRSAGDVDVGDIAIALGGGGHNHSAATIIDGPMEEVIAPTIKKLEMILKSLLKA